jgi:alkyldihydroxyacetonephosphate synthase
LSLAIAEINYNVLDIIYESLNLKIMLGSEGTYGLITDAIVRIQPLPDCQIFGAIIFPNFEQGVKFMRAVAYHRTQPASIRYSNKPLITKFLTYYFRLVDNEQFKFSHALKPKSDSLFACMSEGEE